MDRWVARGTIEPDCGEAIKEVVRHPEWTDLSGAPHAHAHTHTHAHTLSLARAHTHSRARTCSGAPRHTRTRTHAVHRPQAAAAAAGWVGEGGGSVSKDVGWNDGGKGGAQRGEQEMRKVGKAKFQMETALALPPPSLPPSLLPPSLLPPSLSLPPSPLPPCLPAYLPTSYPPSPPLSRIMPRC